MLKTIYLLKKTNWKSFQNCLSEKNRKLKLPYLIVINCNYVCLFVITFPEITTFGLLLLFLFRKVDQFWTFLTTLEPTYIC